MFTGCCPSLWSSDFPRWYESDKIPRMAFLQNFLMKQMLKKQMKDVPEAEQQKVFAAIEANPDFFMNIAKEIETKVKNGMDQQKASIEVMMANQAKLREIMGK